MKAVEERCTAATTEKKDLAGQVERLKAKDAELREAGAAAGQQQAAMDHEAHAI